MDSERSKAKHAIPATAVPRTAATFANQWANELLPLVPKRSVIDWSYAMLRRFYPTRDHALVKDNKQITVETSHDFVETIMALMESKVRKSPGSASKPFGQLVKEQPLVVLMGGQRGSNKTTQTKRLVDALEADGISSTVLHTDSYFRPKGKFKTIGGRRYEGGNENPRNTDIRALLKDVREWKAGKTVAIRAGDYGESHRSTSAAHAPVLICEGIHAFAILRLIKQADLVTAVLIDPLAQMLRAIKRDLDKPRALAEKPHYYFDINTVSNFWWRWTAQRLADADVVLKVGLDMDDLHMLARIPGTHQDDIATRLTAWKAKLRIS